MPIARQIEIITLPHGDAPAWVRAEWIGCRLPCEPECGHVPKYADSVLPSPRTGPLTIAEWKKRPPTKKIAGFSVPQEQALKILENRSRRSAAAAAWWREHGYPKPNMAFRFMHDEVMVVDVHTESKGPVHIYDDMETGTLRPMT